MRERDLTDGARCTLIRFDAVGTAQRRLFCLPFAGGGPSTYRLWPRSLPDDVEVVVIVLPGRDPRTRASSADRPLGTMAELVPPTIEAIVELQSSSPAPFAIFGHSMGAIVAYEITVELERLAESPASLSPVATPAYLFVSGRRPPDELHVGDRIHDLADEPFLDLMQRHYGGVPDAVRREPELLALLLPALRADVEVFETYTPLTGRLVTCPVRVYGGDDDRRPKPAQLVGWQRVAERKISIRTFPGDHFFLNDARHELAADIAAHWAAADADSAFGLRVPESP